MNQATKKGLVGFLLAVLAAFGIYFQPKPLPTPPPAATPAPAPTESPSPVPSPSALPSQAPEPVNVCNYPPSDGACVFDPDGEGRFEAAVYRAQEQAKAEGYLTPDGRVKDERTYTNALARILQTNGVCAVNGSSISHTSEDEIWSRDSDHSEHYDVIRSDGTPILLYAARCHPAKF